MVLIVSKNKVHSWHRRVAFYSYVHIRYFQIVGGRATASKNMRIHTVYVLFFLPFYYSTTPVRFTLSNGQPFYSSTTPCSKYWARRWQQQGISVTDPWIVLAPIKYCLSLYGALKHNHAPKYQLPSIKSALKHLAVSQLLPLAGVKLFIKYTRPRDLLPTNQSTVISPLTGVLGLLRHGC